MKHFDAEGNLHSRPHFDLGLADIHKSHLLRDGDVLFAAKGSRNFAAVYREINLPAVASTTFLILKVRDADLFPEYIAWYLNNENTQTFLRRYATGSSMVSVSKELISGLAIEVPSIARQRLIVKLAKLAERENRIRLEIADLRRKLIEKLISRALHK
jgi:restriction endonuclease S subunit